MQGFIHGKKGSGWSKQLKRWWWDGCEEGTALGWALGQGMWGLCCCRALGVTVPFQRGPHRGRMHIWREEIAVALAAVQKMGRKSLRTWIRARQLHSEPAERLKKGSAQRSVERFIFWEGKAEGMAWLGKWDGRGKEAVKMQKCLKESYLRFVMMVSAAIRLFRWRKAVDVPVVGELLKLNCFWFLIKGSYQFLGRLSPGVSPEAFLNLIRDLGISHLTMQLHFLTWQNSPSSAWCWASEDQQRKFPAAWNTCRAPLCECDRATFGSMGCPRGLPWGRSSQSESLSRCLCGTRSHLCRQLLWVQLPSLKCSGVAALKSLLPLRHVRWCQLCPSVGRASSTAKIWVTEECCEQHHSKTTCLVTSCTLRETCECSLKDECTFSFNFISCFIKRLCCLLNQLVMFLWVCWVYCCVV